MRWPTIDWTRLARLVRIQFRRLRGRCTACGRVPERHAHACWHCSYKNLCHRCGKTRNFAHAYGAGPKMLGRLAEARY